MEKPIGPGTEKKKNDQSFGISEKEEVLLRHGFVIARITLLIMRGLKGRMSSILNEGRSGRLISIKSFSLIANTKLGRTM